MLCLVHTTQSCANKVPNLSTLAVLATLVTKCSQLACMHEPNIQHHAYYNGFVAMNVHIVLSCLMSLTLFAITLGTTINKCTRVCLATERRLYYTFGKMEDGTPCPPTEKGYKEARCAGGYCLVS